MDMSAKCIEVKSIFVATFLPAIGIDDERFLSICSFVTPTDAFSAFFADAADSCCN